MATEQEIMVHQCTVMLEMQDGMNSRVDSDWIERDREWYRAIWIECAELMDHYGGWKWWKSSSPDIEQVMLEIVDIWHFGLSMRIDRDRNFAAAARQIVSEWNGGEISAGFLTDVERLAIAALQTQRFAVELVPVLLSQIERGFADLYRAYVGKNVLNFFRQDHGYRDGTYVKIWSGSEDNEHLVEVLSQLDANAAEFKDQVYAALKERYPGSSAASA